jgi:hypothetical protein
MSTKSRVPWLPKENVYDVAVRWYRYAEDAVNSLPHDSKAKSELLEELKELYDSFYGQFISPETVDSVKATARAIKARVTKIKAGRLKIHNRLSDIYGNVQHCISHPKYHDLMRKFGQLMQRFNQGEWESNFDVLQEDITLFNYEVRDCKREIIANLPPESRG